MTFSVRPATELDAPSVAGLSKEMCDYLRALGDKTDFRSSEETFLRDGFGPDAAFSSLVAEHDGRVIGYLLYHFGYDADYATRIIHVVDLYVSQAHRARGAGRALMQHVADIGRRSAVADLVWSVYKPNKLAHGFYARLGAQYIDDLDYMYLEISPTPS
jgi:GNAT superfamily N-acetyltransferase